MKSNREIPEEMPSRSNLARSFFVQRKLVLRLVSPHDPQRPTATHSGKFGFPNRWVCLREHRQDPCHAWRGLGRPAGRGVGVRPHAVCCRNFGAAFGAGSKAGFNRRKKGLERRGVERRFVAERGGAVTGIVQCRAGRSSTREFLGLESTSCARRSQPMDRGLRAKKALRLRRGMQSGSRRRPSARIALAGPPISLNSRAQLGARYVPRSRQDEGGERTSVDVIEAEIKCQAERHASGDARRAAMDAECASHTRGALAGRHEHEQHE